MKKTVNIEELTAALNGFIQDSKDKIFTRQELGGKMKELGFNDQVSRILIPKVFPYEKLGTSHMYNIPKNPKPIYKGIIEGCYKTTRGYSKKYSSKKIKENKSSVQKEALVDSFTEAKEVNDAIRLLLSKGYKISRPLGLDVKQLLADHPELTQKYMRYANI